MNGLCPSNPNNVFKMCVAVKNIEVRLNCTM